jgi:hypothetical protein
MEKGHERLRVDGRLLGRSPPAEGGGEAAAVRLPVSGQWEPEQVERGRVHVHQPDDGCAEPGAGGDAGAAREEGDRQRRLVDEEPVQRLPVVAQAFSVVGGHDEHGLVPEAEAREGGVEPAEELVRPGHLAVVGALGVPGGVGLGRLVGVVGIVEVQPEEEPPRRPQRRLRLLEPGHGLGRRAVAPLLDGVQELSFPAAPCELVGVDVEAAVQAGRGIEHGRGDEGGGGEAGALQDLGEERHRRNHRGRDVVADPRRRGQAPGEDRDVRGPGQGHVGRSLLGHGPVAGEAVHVGRGHAAVAVGSHPVGPKGVDRDQHEMARCRRRAWRGATARGQHAHARGQRDGHREDAA